MLGGKVQSHEPQLPLPPSQTPPPPWATPPAQRERISSLEYGQVPILNLHKGDPLEEQIPEQAQDRTQEHIIFQIWGAETCRDGNQKVIPTTSNILKSNIKYTHLLSGPFSTSGTTIGSNTILSPAIILLYFSTTSSSTVFIFSYGLLNFSLSNYFLMFRIIRYFEKEGWKRYSFLLCGHSLL